MKIHVEIAEDMPDNEIIIRCKSAPKNLQQIENLLKNNELSNLAFYKDNDEHYISISEIIFFETDGDAVYSHTNEDSYRIKLRLYELEEILPPAFVRISKSAIINVSHISSINRSISSSSLVNFYKSHKQVYVSRRYYKGLKYSLTERNSL